MSNTTTTTTSASTSPTLPVAIPRADIFETKDAFVIVLDVPGVAEKDVQLTLERDTLTLQASQQSQHQQQAGYKPTYQEWPPVTYKRQLTLATDIDRDNIKAQCKQGVLRLHLPKATRAVARKINVTFGND